MSTRIDSKLEEVDTIHNGLEILHDPIRNKGSAFTEEERDRLKLRGLLPPGVCAPELQEQRVLGNYRHQPDDLSRYMYLTALQNRNETLFYKVVLDHLEEMMPIIYTPTVGLACQRYDEIFQRPRGLYVSRRDRGRIVEVLRNWPNRDVRIIVVTDGERILGLGDLGASGMGIPVGKLALYTVCAGVDPARALPITLDVGTDNIELRDAPLYLGLRQSRLRGEAYDAFIEEFVLAVQEVFPRALLQFEDFANANAFRLLETYRDRVCCFNDDIQGTAGVTLAGLLSALRVTGKTLSEQRLLFLGAGEAGIGVSDLIAGAMVDAGLPLEEARGRIWLFDSKALVTADRTDLNPHKRRYAHAHAPCGSFLEAVRDLRPTGIIGVSGKPGKFDAEIIRTMAALNQRPIIFSLSNPTSKTECTAEDAYRHSEGRAIFASGSPFDPVHWNGKTYLPSQGNNAYVFPGVGFGVIVSGARRVTDRMFFAAAKTLAAQVTPQDFAAGRIYPPLTRIREVSAEIACAVARIAYAESLATVPEPADLMQTVREGMYQPRYRDN
jgi:malate dehydrogenase (oxaloacetate-decarboxylating)(NADP+)